MRICSQCNTVNSDDARFCENCGFRLEVQPEPPLPVVEEPVSEIVPEIESEVEPEVVPEVEPEAEPVLNTEDEIQKKLEQQLAEQFNNQVFQTESQPEVPQSEEQQSFAPQYEQQNVQQQVPPQNVQQNAKQPEFSENEAWKQRLEERKARAAKQEAENREIHIPDAVKNVDLKAMKEKGKGQITKGRIIILAEALLLIIVISVFSVIGSSKSSPEGVAKQYFKASSQGNWEKVYGYLNTQSSEFLTKEAFLEIQKDKKVSKVTNFKVLKNSNPVKDSFVQNCIIEYTVEGESEPRQTQIVLVKQQKNNMLFFPSWKVGSAVGIAKDYQITVPKGTEVALDGILLTDNHLVTSENGQDVYKVDIFEGKHTIQTSTPWCKVQEQEFEAYSEDGFWLSESELMDEAKAALEGEMKEGIQKIYAAAMKKEDFSAVADLFDPAYEERNREMYDNCVESIHRREDYKYNKLTLTNFELSGYDFFQDQESSFLNATLDYDYAYDYTYTYKSWFSDEETVQHYDSEGSRSTSAAFVWDGKTYKLAYIDLYSVFN